MYIKNWMTKDVYTVDCDDSVIIAVRMMRDKKIKHLPVMQRGKVVGMVSDRRLKEFLPSKGTALDVYELNYLLENTKIADVMKGELVSAESTLPIEEAAQLLLEKSIGCLPVIDNGKLVGIISDKDIFKALIDITGAHNKGYRITLVLEDRTGSIKEAADIVRSFGFGIESILSGHIDLKDKRRAVIRSRGTGDGEKMKAAILAQYPDAEILYRGDK